MEFQYKKPFRDKQNNVVTMRSKRTVHNKVDIQVNENSKNYLPENLKPMTDQEYQAYLENDLE